MEPSQAIVGYLIISVCGTGIACIIFHRLGKIPHHVPEDYPTSAAVNSAPEPSPGPSATA